MHNVTDDVGGSVGGGELHLQFASGGHDKVGGLVLIRVRMTADDDGLLPASDQSWNVLADDRLTEDGAAEDVADGAVGGFPHRLELEFLHAGLIRSDGGALDANAVLLDGLGAVHGDFVVGLVAVLHSQVVSEGWVVISRRSVEE